MTQKFLYGFYRSRLFRSSEGHRRTGYLSETDPAQTETYVFPYHISFFICNMIYQIILHMKQKRGPTSHGIK